jgi:hypothetical protein
MNSLEQIRVGNGSYFVGYHSTESGFVICDPPKKDFAIIHDLNVKKHPSYKLVVESYNTDYARIMGRSLLVFNKYSCYIPLVFIEKGGIRKSDLPSDTGRSSNESSILRYMNNSRLDQIARGNLNYIFSSSYISKISDQKLSHLLGEYGNAYKTAKNNTLFGKELLGYLGVNYSGTDDLAIKVNNQIDQLVSETLKIQEYLSGSPPTFYVYYLINKEGFDSESFTDGRKGVKVLMYSYNRQNENKPHTSDVPVGKTDVKTISSEPVK